jgi:GDP/UDP-N,N'-diacetylbacillosamine 2-epimerase (hydrolysing)
MTRKICVVTGSRAEFGLLRWLMHEIDRTHELKLQVVVTGMHLSPEYGSTYREVEGAGFAIDHKVEMLLGANTATAVAKSVGLGTIGFADAYDRLKPDLIVVLGDRFELISAVTPALVAGIPVAHLHGGETTEGAFDESIRHAMTKMSHLHFVATDDYARRVIQLGEQPDRVFTVGGLGIDAIRHMKLLDRATLEQQLDFSLGKKSLLVTFHPVTLENGSSLDQMTAMLDALDELEDTQLLFTAPNADNGSQELAAALQSFVRDRPNARLFTSLGQLRYFSCMQFVDGVVGNSSSGLAEAPSMGIGTVDIGDRQKGRLAAKSVIHCSADREGIRLALRELYDPGFKAMLATIENPYGDGGASEKIAQIIADYPLHGLLRKKFFDLPTGNSDSVGNDGLEKP